jgi:hypothetical protein
MQQKSTKTYRVNFQKTFQNLKAAVEKLTVVEPPKVEGGKPTVKKLIKGNVYSTLKDIYRLHMMEKRKQKSPGSIALRTKNPSLARVTQNSERTIRRHIETLIKHGLIQAKARLGHGIQLLLSAAILEYDEHIAPFIPKVNLKAPTAPVKASNLLDLARGMTEKFSMKSALGTP